MSIIEYYDNGNIKSEGILNYESREYVEYYKNGQIKKRKAEDSEEIECWDEDGNKIECN
jgi:antitoxin component YwqK of YwqJK toxin-antitoxin module